MADDRIGLTAAKDHVIHRSRVSAHVVVCHDIDVRIRDVIGMFSAAQRMTPAILQDMARELLTGIMADIKGLQDQLRGYERWTRAELEKLPEIVSGEVEP